MKDQFLWPFDEEKMPSYCYQSQILISMGGRVSCAPGIANYAAPPPDPSADERHTGVCPGNVGSRTTVVSFSRLLRSFPP